MQELQAHGNQNIWLIYIFLILRKDQKKERYDIIDCSLKVSKKGNSWVLLWCQQNPRAIYANHE